MRVAVHVDTLVVDSATAIGPALQAQLAREVEVALAADAGFRSAQRALAADAGLRTARSAPAHVSAQVASQVAAAAGAHR